MAFKIIDCEQGTPEWFQMRLGKITGSILAKVITPAGKISASRDEIVNRAVAELILNTPDETFQSDSMLRGKMLEDDALQFFNFVHGFDFEKCGFLAQVDDNGNETGYGISPDAIKKMITLELKCPEAHTHLAYLAASAVPRVYFQQAQAPFLLGIEQVFFGSYHPAFPCMCVEVKPDDAFLKAATPIVKETTQMIVEKYQLLSKMVEAS